MPQVNNTLVINHTVYTPNTSVEPWFIIMSEICNVVINIELVLDDK